MLRPSFVAALAARGQSAPWPFSTWPHPAAADVFRGLLACGMLVATAVADEPVVRLGGDSVLAWATVEDGAAVLASEDEFTRHMSPLDRQARLHRNDSVSDAEYRAFAAGAVEPWNEGEKRLVAEALDGLAARLEALHVTLPPRVLLVKTSGVEEGGAAYTRGTAVMLPRKVLASTPRSLRRLVCHELFHVLSRHRPDLREQLFAIIGFVPCGDVVLPGDLQARRLTNPDAPGFDHAIRVQCDGAEQWMVPVLFFRTGAPQPAPEQPFFKAMEFRLLAVAIEGMPPCGTPLLDAAARPILRTPEEVRGFFEQTGRNTGYLIHPEEILADNFALLVTGASGAAEGVRNPAILGRIQQVLREDAVGPTVDIDGRPRDRPEAGR